MEKPIVSIFSSAYRTHWWKEIYDFFSATNDISFEIVFVGQNKPNFNLPDNFKYIYSNVKLAQCVEAAYRNTSGEYVVYLHDDCVYNDNFLDNLYNFILEKIQLYRNQNIIVSAIHYKEIEKIPYSFKKYGFWNGDKKSPLLPVCFIMKRDKWKEAGGIDKKFITSFGDWDLSMRVLSNNGKIYFCEKSFFYERDRKKRINLTQSQFAMEDSKSLNGFWSKSFKLSNKKANNFSFKLKKVRKLYNSLKKINELEKFNDIYNSSFSLFFKQYGIDDALNILFFRAKKGVIFKNRLFPVKSFKDKDIFIKSQGTRGNKWD